MPLGAWESSELKNTNVQNIVSPNILMIAMPLRPESQLSILGK